MKTFILTKKAGIQVGDFKVNRGESVTEEELKQFPERVQAYFASPKKAAPAEQDTEDLIEDPWKDVTNKQIETYCKKNNIGVAGCKTKKSKIPVLNGKDVTPEMVLEGVK